MSERTAKARDVMNYYVKWAAGAGLIPFPLLDVAAVTGVQIKMLTEMAKVYDLPFSRERAKAIVGSLVSGLSGPMLAGVTLGLLGPTLKFMPGLGTLVGAAVMPAATAAVTYATGRVFIQHFEAGGTFLDLDPDRVREYFQKEFETARQRGTAAPTR